MPFLRPIADVDIGNWSTQAGGTTALFSAIHETDFDDSTYVTTEAVGGASTPVLFRLSDPGPVNSPLTVRFRARATGSNATLTTVLYQDAVIIAQWSDELVAGGFSTVTHTLSTDEFNSISDFADLLVKFIVGSGSGSDGTATFDSTTITWDAITHTMDED